MLFSLLVTAREGVEIALIVTILLGYLRRIDQKRHFREIWYGVGAAAVLSLAIGIGLELASHELDGRVLAAFEGFTMLFAVAVLTWMLFWMKRHSAGISGELRHQIDTALSGGSVVALALLAFSSVGREGLETVLFLFAGSNSGSSDVMFILGGVAGFALATAVGVVLYYGSAKLPLRQFFFASAVALMVLAAGMLSNALVELQEAALLSELGPRPWDTESIISATSDLGKFLHTILGYDSAPTLAQIALYWGYLTVILSAYLAWPSPAPPLAQRAPAPTVAVPLAKGE
jgi:high-affinity iron transporter